jgi:ribose/xylose/arabinose/galactoside ABC-type transport system permease subunit
LPHHRDVGRFLASATQGVHSKGHQQISDGKAATTVPLVIWIIILVAALVVGLYQKSRFDKAIRRRGMELEAQKYQQSNPQKEQ